MKIESIGVLGGGAWGTALAQTLALSGREVLLWAMEPETVADINESRVNHAYLPRILLHENVTATSSLADVAQCDALLLVAPAQHMRELTAQLAGDVAAGKPAIICAKGIEQKTGKLLGDVLAETLPQARLAALSGPSFASDVARGLPAALTLACADEEIGRQLAVGLGYRQLRIYWSRDLVGVQLGGAVKNVLAIAAGIVDGQELGASAHAALVTRGFAELCRFSEAMGAEPSTLLGLSGLGDLILTCGSPMSRNMSLGRALGQGKSLDEVLGKRRAVTEGVYTAQAVNRIAAEKNVELPIVSAVNAIISGDLTVDDAIEGLLTRPMRAEAQ